MPMKIPDNLKEYIEMLLEYNKYVNLVSRKTTHGELEQLLSETLFLDQYISNDQVVDAGSGNGILGIPLALADANRKLTLVEPKRKKYLFLQQVKEKMNLTNVDVQGISIEEYLSPAVAGNIKIKTLVSRGFPRFNVFCRWINQGRIAEAVIITSENKIKKNQKALEIVAKKTYNIPWREHLKILKMAKIDR
jgi:16S rRNA (guanine527-N7)-methyltransferase